MNKFTKNFYDGTVLSFDGKVYYIRLPGGKNVIMKFTVMHQMCSFPDSMLENGHIKDGTKIHLCEIRRSDGETILPDHRYYFDADKEERKAFPDADLVAREDFCRLLQDVIDKPEMSEVVKESVRLFFTGFDQAACSMLRTILKIK